MRYIFISTGPAGWTILPRGKIGDAGPRPCGIVLHKAAKPEQHF